MRVRRARAPLCRNRTHGTGRWRTRGLHSDDSRTVVQMKQDEADRCSNRRDRKFKRLSTTCTAATISRFGHGVAFYMTAISEGSLISSRQ